MDAVRYYEHWVNGGDLRVAQLASGAAPTIAPASSSPSDSPGGERLQFTVAHYGDAQPVLPALSPDALKPIAHVLVHGSAATQDSCDFSDVDVAVFVDDERAYAPEEHRSAVLELRRLLDAAFRYDGLMHHGLMFYPASGLRRYDDRFLPIAALRCARSLHGSSTIELRHHTAPREAFARSLKLASLSLRQRFAALDFLYDDFALKNVLAGILLMPSRVLAAQGVQVYKRDSFELARPLFDGAQWELVARSEALRAFWKRPPETAAQHYLPRRTHPRLRQILGARFSPRLNTARLSQRMIDGLTRSSNAFLDRVEALV